MCPNAPREQGPKKKPRDRDRNRDPDQDLDSKKTRRVRQAEEESDSKEAEEISDIREMKQWMAPPIKVPVKIDGINVQMEVDTGASVRLISEKQFSSLWPNKPVEASRTRLHNYSNDPIPVVGSVQMKVAYEGQTATLPLVIVRGGDPPLLGRNWVQAICLNWTKIHSVLSTGIQNVVTRHEDVFKPGLGKYKGFSARIDVDPQASPRFYKARTVPYSKQDLVDQELDRLVQEGNLEPDRTACGA